MENLLRNFFRDNKKELVYVKDGLILLLGEWYAVFFRPDLPTPISMISIFFPKTLHITRKECTKGSLTEVLALNPTEIKELQNY